MKPATSRLQPVVIRPSLGADVPAITAIYAHHVLHSTGTFETEPPTQADITKRRTDVLTKGLPFLVAEQDGQVIGFCYGSWFRPRAAYRYCVEDSIYLAPQTMGKGLGRALLAELLTRCIQVGMRKAMAVIGDSNNSGSIALHQALGFSQVGVLSACGWKLGAWRDVVIMERTLGVGFSEPPAEESIALTEHRLLLN